MALAIGGLLAAGRWCQMRFFSQGRYVAKDGHRVRQHLPAVLSRGSLSLAQMLRPKFLMDCGGFVFEVRRANHSDDARACLQHRPARYVQPDPGNLAKPHFGARKHHTPDPDQ